MKYLVDYVEEIQTDLQEIIDWYKNQRAGLDREFIESFKAAVAQIIENPLIYRVRAKKGRFKHLDRFPYIIIFKVVRDAIIVFGVMHDRRNPKLIRKRIK